ncbi:DUF433 domain-containing protein [Azospirillum sp. B4]|uniref:DUF433 domain-containing protein n=1 Tax=Azospirillum sp. B4 TaxID=95605 RepID=UPI00034A23F8|nr:DUF433 domain-containing protein [Azospirillum sp. B4]
MTEATEWTAPQSAFLLEKPLIEVKRAIDRGVVRATVVERGRIKGRRLRVGDLVYLQASSRLAEKLTPSARNDLYDQLRDVGALKGMPRRIKLSWGTVDIAPDVDAIAKRINLLHRVEDRVSHSASGEPLIPATTVEIYRIAALLDGGATVDDVLHEFPSLTAEQVDQARAYAAIHPKRGRPFPKKGLKRSLQDLGLDMLDEVLGVPDCAGIDEAEE